METRNITLTLDKAKEWYNSGNKALKEASLQAFTEDELKKFDFRSITTMDDVLKVNDITDFEYKYHISTLKKYSKASVASFKLNLIRKALNMGREMDFEKGTIWYPYTPAVLSYYKDSQGVEVAKVLIGSNTFTLLGGNAYYSIGAGLGYFYSDEGVADSAAYVGFLGCATKEIAQHFGRYFSKEIFEAKYGDLIDYEWID